MKLTIGMIVKNEEKWLDKCLSAIKPILDNVDSELIITDTGSTDKTVEIAKNYTDKVLHFDWINDFAAARNFGLEKAQGEWFMMLDADDIFRSCDHIIEFFNSGEYMKYNAASYISRNIFKTENGDSYGDLLAPRMVKLYPNTRYENAIHEALNTFQPPYKNINDIADHYGYYYETEEDKYNKFKRNSELLLRRFETEKDTAPMLYVQLYEAFMGIKEYEKALWYLDSGIELCKQKDSIVLAALYFHKASYYQTDKMFEQAIAVCDEYFRMSKAIRPYQLNTDGEIYAIKAVSQYELKEYAEAVSSFKNFFNVHKDIESGKTATYDSYLISAYMCGEINIMPLFNKFIDSCIKSEKYNTADNYLSFFPVDKYSFETDKIFELVKLELTVAEHFSYKNISEYYKKLEDHGKQILFDELLHKLSDQNSRSKVLNAISILTKSNERMSEKVIIYRSFYEGDKVASQISDYIKKNGTSQNLDLVFLILNNQYDLSPVLLDSKADLKKCVYVCCKNISGFYEAVENYNTGMISDVKALSFAEKFFDYCISIKLLDNEDKSEEEKEQLITKLVMRKSDIKKRIKESAASEFDRLAITIKNNIKSYIRSGDYSSAKKTFDEYIKINPADPDISYIRKEIGDI